MGNVTLIQDGYAEDGKKQKIGGITTGVPAKHPQTSPIIYQNHPSQTLAISSDTRSPRRGHLV